MLTHMYIISSAKVIEPSTFSHLFDSVTFVIASKDCNLDSAMEDAIIANAIDVEEIKDESGTYFKVLKYKSFYSNNLNLIKRISIFIQCIFIFICYSLKVNFFIQKKL